MVIFRVTILAFPKDFKLHRVFYLEKSGHTSAKLSFFIQA